jgi:hypothetical protein
LIIELPPKIDADWVERAFAGCLEDPADSVLIEIKHWEGSSGLAEGRLLQWMLRLEQSGKRTLLSLGQQLPALGDAPRHPLWQTLRDRLGALILAEAAKRILDPGGVDRREEIGAAQRSQLSAQGGDVGSGSEQAVVRLDRIGSPTSLRAFTDAEDDFELIRARIRQFAGGLNLEPIGGEHLEELASFAYEAVENTREHACDDLGGAAIDGLRFLQIRRLSVTRRRGMDQLLTSKGGLQAYLERLSTSAELGDEKVASFVEVTIADSGIGIPARLLGSTDVYSDPLSAETELTLRAMRPDSSSKARSIMGRGQGLFNAMRMAALLRGLVVVRTGRLELIRDTTLAPARGQDGWHINELEYLPGTTISLLLPWWQGAQARLGADQPR